MRVLIAEDNLVQRNYLKKILEHSGHEVEAAADGLAAWDILCRGGPSMLITDLVMPGLDGLELVKRIRAKEFPGYICAIILTSQDEKGSLIACLEAGADDYLTKPFDADELRARLLVGERVLGREAKLRELACRDPLSGLLNRRSLIAQAEVEIARARAQGQAIGALMLDIDHFKAINDGHGHPVGDLAIKAVAAVLSSGKRPYDLAGRWGGEEFLVLLPGLGLDEARRAAEAYRQAVAALSIPLPGGEALRFTASIGVGAFGAGLPYAGLDELVKSADSGLYLAKSLGRNRVEAAPSG